MVRYDHDRTIARRSLDVFETVHIHNVVRGKMDPTRAHRALAPRPKPFPPTTIHPFDKSKGETFER
jgi:hypothetical protein